MKMKKLLKKVIVGSGEKIRKIRFGIAKGIIMQIDAGSKSQRILGLDEQEIQAPFKKYALQSDYFFDIGSSDGYYSLIYKKWNPEGKIYAFEVKEDLTEEMKDNFIRNKFNYGDVTLTKKFVAAKNDEKHISLDTLFEQKGQKLFFKIDVDGGEMDVLNGMKNVLANNRCLFVIETHTPELEKDCIAFLQNAGYNTTIINNASWRSIIPENRPIAHNRWFTAQKN